MPTRWPNKSEREGLEIEYFLKAYARTMDASPGKAIARGEKPDYVVSLSDGAEVGVELTSVYSDDRSVPAAHMHPTTGHVPIPFDRSALDKYKERLVAAVLDKAAKARAGYDISRPLILGVYVNDTLESISIGMNFKTWFDAILLS